jgi:sortase (surface protein transpeptidase)
MALRIPSIGVDAGMVYVGREEDRTMAVPRDAAMAGWYVHSPSPGDLGPAVIVGHVAPGPAVFASLERLVPGELVEVTRVDGSVARFAVTRVERHPKDAFPTAAVYGDTLGPELRLITCGGNFNPLTRHYTDNVIAFAVAV